MHVWDIREDVQMHSAQLLLCMAGETVARGKKKEDGTERVVPAAAAASFLAHLCYPRCLCRYIRLCGRVAGAMTAERRIHA